MTAQAQTATTQRSTSVPMAALLAAALLVGGIGGYAMRAAGPLTQIAVTQDASAQTVLIPRSAREGDGVSREGSTSPVSRVLREGPERGDGTR